MQVELVTSQNLAPRPRFLLPLGRRLVIGRSPEADLHLPMRFISRRHAGIEWSGCATHIEDYQSRNGVFVNDRRLGTGPHPLLPGDVLALAGIHLFLRGSVCLAPDWLRRDQGLIPRLIRQIEDEGDFDAMPILGDALEEMGCTDEELLAHCHLREHAPGCFVFRILADQVAQWAFARHGWAPPEDEASAVSLWPHPLLSDKV